jgi:tetratricopeptide (TPR) repeat protein
VRASREVALAAHVQAAAAVAARPGAGPAERRAHAIVEARAGRLAEARVALAALEREGHGAAEAASDLGNVLLLEGAPAEAAAAYARAAASGSDPRVWVNLGLARYVAGEDALALEAFADAVQRGGASVLAAAGFLRDAARLGLRAAAPGGPDVAKDDLERLLAEVLRRVPGGPPGGAPGGKARYVVPLPTAGRRGQDAAARSLVAPHLTWL